MATAVAPASWQCSQARIVSAAVPSAAPATTGTRPAVAWQTISTIRRRSSGVKRRNSPVEPFG